MNVILIPFFLAANVFVNDTSEWTYGPEYSYSMIYVIESEEPVSTLQLMTAIKCRPKVLENSLLCRLQNSTTTVFLKKDNTSREIETEQMFEVRFNERGVESLLIEPPFRMEVVNFIRMIANQLSVGTDMKRKIGMTQFMARENTSMGDCATMYKITREEPLETPLEPADNVDFQLVVLPMTDARPGTSFTIQKSRMGCINPPRYVDFSMGILKMGRFFSKIYIDGVNGFETFTELDGKLRPPIESLSSRIITFKGRLRLSLDSIEPAQDPLPSIFYGELIGLNMNTDIPTNMID